MFQRYALSSYAFTCALLTHAETSDAAACACECFLQQALDGASLAFARRRTDRKLRVRGNGSIRQICFQRFQSLVAIWGHNLNNETVKQHFRSLPFAADTFKASQEEVHKLEQFYGTCLLASFHSPEAHFECHCVHTRRLLYGAYVRPIHNVRIVRSWGLTRDPSYVEGPPRHREAPESPDPGFFLT